MSLRVLQIRKELSDRAAAFLAHQTIAVGAGAIRLLLREFDDVEAELDRITRQLNSHLVAAAEERLEELLAPEDETFVLRN